MDWLISVASFMIIGVISPEIQRGGTQSAIDLFTVKIGSWVIRTVTKDSQVKSFIGSGVLFQELISYVG